MRVTVKIEERFFEVEIGNLHTRPIIAIVEGEQFEIWPESTFAPRSVPAAAPASTVSSPAPAPRPATSAAVPVRAPGADVRAVYAPIPGVIVHVLVRPGDQVETGQELCVLEAMKMKNSIRSPRTGEIGRVAVAAGDQVKHHDLLFEFSS